MTKTNAQWVSWNETTKTYAITDRETAERMVGIGNPYGFNRTALIVSMKLLLNGLKKRGYSPVN